MNDFIGDLLTKMLMLESFLDIEPFRAVFLGFYWVLLVFTCFHWFLQVSVDHSFDVDPFQGSVWREKIAVVHTGRRVDDKIRLRNQGDGTQLSEGGVDLRQKEIGI